MPTEAFLTFEAAFADAKHLLAIHDAQQKAGATTERIEVLKRASVILAVTAWETYLEDLLLEEFTPLLSSAENPADLPNAFDEVAKRWLKNPGSLTATGLTSWAGDRWKEHIKTFFDSQIRSLNTPNSKNVRRLFTEFLNIDLETVWKWPGHDFDSACKRLDDIVSKRGAFTHVARTRSSSVPAKHALSRQQLLSCLKFFEEIASTTDGGV